MEIRTRHVTSRDRGSAAVSATARHLARSIRRLPGRSIAVAVIMLFIGIAVGPNSSSATTLDVAAFQAASLVATPASVDPTECRVAPRPAEDYAALAEAPPGVHLSVMLGTPIPSPTPPAGGVSADPVVVAAVTATARELTACVNAGVMGRMAALYTDRAFLWLFRGGYEELSPEDIAQYVAAMGTVTPLPPERYEGIISVEDVQLLPNGLVTAVVQGFEGEALTYFAEEDGRYLIDTGFAWPLAGTPTP